MKRRTTVDSTATIKVALLMRKPLPGQQSVERVFRGVAAALPTDISVRIVSVPFVSRGLFRRLGNMVFAAFLRADVVHVTGDIQYCTILLRRRYSLLTVLDLTSVRRLSGWRRLALTWIWYRIPCRRALRITTISRATLEELLELLPELATKCSVVPCPVGPEFLDSVETREIGNPPVALLVGTGANKNLERTVSALAELDIRLRIVGPLSQSQRSVLERSGLSYESGQRLSDHELVEAYSDSDILVFTSLYEGFGLPIVEAQAVGLPVVTSNVASMPEVAGLGAVIVDPTNESEIRNAVTSVLDSAPLRQALIQSGRLNVERFSPRAIAEEYARIYRYIGAGASARRDG